MVGFSEYFVLLVFFGGVVGLLCLICVVLSGCMFLVGIGLGLFGCVLDGLGRFVDGGLLLDVYDYVLVFV